MKQKSSDSSDQLKNATPRRSLGHTSPHGIVNTSNDNIQPPHTSISDTSISEHQPVTSTESSPTITYGTPENYDNMDPNQLMDNQMLLLTSMKNGQCFDNSMCPILAENSSDDRNMESTSNGDTNLSNFMSQPLTQQTVSANTEGAACSPSSLAVQYSDEEAASLMVKLCSDDTFRPALQLLTSWLENKEIIKGNSTFLLRLINCALNNIWRLMSEKAKYEEALNNVNLSASQKVNNIISHFQEIWKVFEKVELQENWGQFTEPQRKTINTWKQEIEKIVSGLSKELDIENIVPSEDSSERSKNLNLHKDVRIEEYQKYQEELDTLKNQVMAIEDNNITAQKEEETKTKFLDNAMVDVNNQYDEMCAQLEEMNKSFQEDESLNKNNEENENSMEKKVLKYNSTISDGEKAIVAAICSFLRVHPFGATIDNIALYLKNINTNLNTDCDYIENLLCSFPRIFREEPVGVGTNLTKYWLYVGFERTSK